MCCGEKSSTAYLKRRWIERVQEQFRISMPFVTLFISWLHKQEESCIDGINSRLSTHGFWGIFTMCLSLLIETSFEAFQWKFNLFLENFYLLFARIYETCVRRTLWFSHSSHWSSKCVIWMEQSPQYNKLLLQILANYFPISAKCNLMLF